MDDEGPGMHPGHRLPNPAALSDQPSVARCADAYAAHGLAVFPLAPRSKAPLFPAAHRGDDPLRYRCRGGCGRVGHGFYDATTDQATVAAWFGEHPRAGVGVRTGATSGLLVLDVDPRNGGDATLAAFEHEYGALKALVCRTGGGGRHLYLLDPGGPVVATLGDGLDVKHEGGYVAAPPTIHPATGRRYAWEAGGGLRLGLVPGWLLALLRPPPPPAPQPRATVPKAADGRAGTYVERALQGELDRMTEARPGRGGERRKAVLRAALRLGQLEQAGADREQVLARLLDHAQRLGWPQADRTRAAAEAAWELGTQQPRRPPT